MRCSAARQTLHLDQLLHAAANLIADTDADHRAADAKQFLEAAVLSDDATIAQADGRIHECLRARPQAGRWEELLRTDVLLMTKSASCGNRPVRA